MFIDQKRWPCQKCGGTLEVIEFEKHYIVVRCRACRDEFETGFSDFGGTVLDYLDDLDDTARQEAKYREDDGE